MMGTQRLALCLLSAKEALGTYLNEHVFSANHQVRVAELKWEDRGSPTSDAGPALVISLDPADEVSAGRSQMPAEAADPSEKRTDTLKLKRTHVYLTEARDRLRKAAELNGLRGNAGEGPMRWADIENADANGATHDLLMMIAAALGCVHKACEESWRQASAAEGIKEPL